MPSHNGEEITKELGIPYPSVLAHRGSSIVAPESTAPAYILARKKGCDYVEADLQRTKDGIIVIFHNRTLEHITNVKQIFPNRKNYNIEDFSYQELRKLDFGSWFNQRFPQQAKAEYQGLNILTLEELIAIIEEGKNSPGLSLEFKNSHLYPGIEKTTVKILSQKGWLDHQHKMNNQPILEQTAKNNSSVITVGQGPARLIFMSFDIHSLDRIKNLVPNSPRILLINDNMIFKKNWNRWLNLASERAHGLGPKGFMCWPWYIAAAHNQGLFVYPYVINQAWQAKILSLFKADGYITDKPELILDFLGRIFELSSIPD